MPASVSLDARSDGVALLTLNNPPVNSLSPQVLGELAVKLKEAQARSDVKAIVLIGANGKFSGGADIKSMSKTPDKVRGTEVSGLALMNNFVEGSPKPVVAAIAGFALGGGLELAMACHARVAAPGARLGLPELQLGIIPGLGGTQRLPRLVGVETAIDMMLSVKMLTTEEAHQRGLVDAVCNVSELIAAAADYGLGIVDHKYPFAKTLERTDKLGPTEKALEVLTQAKERARRTYEHVDYPFVCLDAVEHGIRNGGLEGTILERKLGVQIVSTPAAKALMHIFFAERAAYKVPGVNERELDSHRIRRVGVVGGGLMGSGIATALLFHNVHVQLKEVDEIRLQAAVKRIQSNLQSRVRKGSMTEGHYQKAVACLVASTGYEGFDKVDLVVEAAVETIPVKVQIFQELDKVCSPKCILASNTSSFDLSVITEGVSCPERIVGAHFFSPAHVMRLLEVIRTEKTSKSTILCLLSLSKTLKKVPVVVRNTVGFAVNRVFFPYRRIALFLVDLGIHPYRIDAVIKGFGMPMGPFRLEDLAGHTIGLYVKKLFEKEFGDRVYTSALEDILVRENRIGESVGKGYYNYYGTREPQHAAELDKYLEESRKVANLPQRMQPSSITDKDIMEMVFFPIVNEACRVVDDGIVIRASDLDIASVLGMGFPAFRGGILFWAETIGFTYILSRLTQWQSLYGSYFRPTFSLHKLVALKASRL